MGGMTKPKTLIHDPTPEAVRPLQQYLSDQFITRGFNATPWGNSYGAPLNTLQLDSMGAIERMLGADPLAQTTDIQSAIAQALGGGGPNAPRTDLTDFQTMFEDLFGQAAGATSGEGADLIRASAGLTPATGALFESALPAFQTMLGGPSFDETEAYKNARQVFESDLDRSLATAREEFSNLGLDPGSSTRAAGLADTAATAAARFGLGQQDIARESFENAQNRSLQTLGLTPGLTGAFQTPQEQALRAGSALSNVGLAGTGIAGNLLGMNLEAGQIPFREALAEYSAGLEGQNVAGNLIPNLMNAFNNPALLANLGFNIGEGARSVDQGEIDRMMAEYARTQNAFLPFMLSLIGGSPQTQATYGPSTLSQFGSFIGDVGKLAPWNWGK